MATKKAAAGSGGVVTAADKVAVLADILSKVRQTRFDLDQSGVTLSDVERRRINADYDAARDAYYQGLSTFVDAEDDGVQQVMDDAEAAVDALGKLKTNQDNKVKILDAISSVVGLAGKLLVLGGA
jgi:hypothetical protein